MTQIIQKATEKIIPKKENVKKKKQLNEDCKVDIELINNLRPKALQTKKREDKDAYRKLKLIWTQKIGRK